MTAREKPHRLVDALDEAELAAEDDEPWTEADDAAVAESDAEFAAGRTLSHEEMLDKYA